MNVLNILNLLPTAGEVGIEIELENERFPANLFDEYWKTVRDGSLRRNGAEYVLRHPIERDAVALALSDLKDATETQFPIPSTNAGVHVHINVQDLNMKQVAQIICLYLLLEDKLVRYCGKSRENNLFCLRASDAQDLVQYIAHIFSSAEYFRLEDDDYRYASINLTSLPKYGSLEFRAMRSDGDFEAVQKWVNILLQIKDAALRFNSPLEIVELASMQGHIDLARDVLGEYADDIIRPEDEKSLVRSARRIQDIAYCVMDWSEVETRRGVV